MSRNENFDIGREPLQHVNTLQLQNSHVRGPVSFLNPTRAIFQPQRHKFPGAYPRDDERDRSEHHRDGRGAEDVQFQWRSRDNRKGRHALLVKPAKDTDRARYIVPLNTATVRATLKGIWRMASYAPYWDVSYLVAFSFTIGSVIWVLNAFFGWLPLVKPSSEFKNEESATGVTAFVGATVFEVGSVLLLLEAVNEHTTGCFGWAFEKVVREEGMRVFRVRPDRETCFHHHSNTQNVVGKGQKTHKTLLSHSHTISSPDGRSFQFFPSLSDLRNHYFREIGFLASFSQFMGATIFWISGFTALPGINDHLSQGLSDGIFWTPQVVGGIGFIISRYFISIYTRMRISLLADFIPGIPST